MRKPLRIAAWTGGILLVLAVLVALGLYWAARQVPSWYQEAIDTTEREGQRKASDEMERRLADLVSGVNTTGRWEVVFTADEINGWLAVGLSEKHPDVLPPGFSDPRVIIEPDGLTVAGRVERTALRGVVSLKVDVYLAEPNAIAVRVRKARAGSLPWPLGKVLDAISRSARQLEVPLRWSQTEGDPVALFTIPPIEEGKRVRIEALQLGEGEVYVAGVTEKVQKQKSKR